MKKSAFMMSLGAAAMALLLSPVAATANGGPEVSVQPDGTKITTFSTRYDSMGELLNQGASIVAMSGNTDFTLKSGSHWFLCELSPPYAGINVMFSSTVVSACRELN